MVAVAGLCRVAFHQFNARGVALQPAVWRHSLIFVLRSVAQIFPVAVGPVFACSLFRDIIGYDRISPPMRCIEGQFPVCRCKADQCRTGDAGKFGRRQPRAPDSRGAVPHLRRGAARQRIARHLRSPLVTVLRIHCHCIAGRHRQDLHPVGADLAGRHCGFRRDERGRGRMGLTRPYTSPCDGRGETCRPRLSGRSDRDGGVALRRQAAPNTIATPFMQ